VTIFDQKRQKMTFFDVKKIAPLINPQEKCPKSRPIEHSRLFLCFKLIFSSSIFFFLRKKKKNTFPSWDYSNEQRGYLWWKPNENDQKPVIAADSSTLLADKQASEDERWISCCVGPQPVQHRNPAPRTRNPATNRPFCASFLSTWSRKQGESNE